MERFFYFDEISLKFVPEGPIDNNDKPLTEPMLNQSIDAYIRQ